MTLDGAVYKAEFKPTADRLLTVVECLRNLTYDHIFTTQTTKILYTKF